MLYRTPTGGTRSRMRHDVRCAGAACRRCQFHSAESDMLRASFSRDSGFFVFLKNRAQAPCLRAREEGMKCPVRSGTQGKFSRSLVVGAVCVESENHPSIHRFSARPNHFCAAGSWGGCLSHRAGQYFHFGLLGIAAGKGLNFSFRRCACIHLYVFFVKNSNSPRWSMRGSM